MASACSSSKRSGSAARFLSSATTRNAGGPRPRLDKMLGDGFSAMRYGGSRLPCFIPLDVSELAEVRGL